jgi:hypothetical protein
MKTSCPPKGERPYGPSFARLSTLIVSEFTREDDHDKRQPSTSLSDGTIHFFISRCSVTTCNDIFFIHQGVCLKDKRAFLVEKYALSCRRHFPGVDFREIASLSTPWAILTSHTVVSVFMMLAYIYSKYNASLQTDSRSRLSRDAF